MSDYMSMSQAEADGERARRVAARMLRNKGYEILDERFKSAGGTFLVARDPERGALAFVSCRIVEELTEECPVSRAAFESALIDWVSGASGGDEAEIRLDDVQFRPVRGTTALARYHKGALE